MARLPPDWERSAVLLVDPIIWKEYGSGGCDVRPVYEGLTTALDGLEVEHHLLTKDHSPLDIWIRDWGFVEGHYFRFAPSYAKNCYSQAQVQKARKHLDQF